MATKYKIGDHVSWNYQSQSVSGKITKIHKRDFDFKGKTYRATSDDPHYEVKSDKSNSLAVHKGDAFRKKE